MKTRLQKFLMIAACASVFLSFTGCDDDNDPGPQLTGDSETYDLAAQLPGISGMVTVADRDDGKIVVTIELSGTQAGATHPAHIHANTAAEGGPIVLDLNPVTDGRSETVVDALNDGTALTYDALRDVDGYVNVHLSDTDLGTLVAQGDIGQNSLTGDKMDYPLADVGAGVSGIATFAKRQNGKTLITLALSGTADGGDHPAHIHANDAATGGGIVLDLKNVNGATGKSATSAETLKDGTAITYDELIAFNGHINVHLSPTELGVRIAQGNIGSNVP